MKSERLKLEIEKKYLVTTIPGEEIKTIKYEITELLKGLIELNKYRFGFPPVCKFLENLPTIQANNLNRTYFVLLNKEHTLPDY